MPNKKKNVRNSTYIALGACAIGFTQITKKGEMISTKLGTVKKQIKPKVETTAENISNSFSNNVAPFANDVICKVIKRSEDAISSTIKIAKEAKSRIH